MQMEMTIYLRTPKRTNQHRKIRKWPLLEPPRRPASQPQLTQTPGAAIPASGIASDQGKGAASSVAPGTTSSPKTDAALKSQVQDLQCRLKALEVVTDKEAVIAHNGLLEIMPIAKTTPYQFHHQTMSDDVRSKILSLDGVIRIYTDALTIFVELRNDREKLTILQKITPILKDKPVRCVFSESYCTKSLERPGSICHSSLKFLHKEGGGKWPLEAPLLSLSAKTRRDVHFGMTFKNVTIMRAMLNNNQMTVYFPKKIDLGGGPIDGSKLVSVVQAKFDALQGYPWPLLAKTCDTVLPAPYTEASIAKERRAARTKPPGK